jgi:hypothetical protein
MNSRQISRLALALLIAAMSTLAYARMPANYNRVSDNAYWCGAKQDAYDEAVREKAKAKTADEKAFWQGVMDQAKKDWAFGKCHEVWGNIAYLVFPGLGDYLDRLRIRLFPEKPELQR